MMQGLVEFQVKVGSKGNKGNKGNNNHNHNKNK